jgi:hypothetical protein
VRGVIYQSARNGGGKCCALFVRNKQCCEAAPGWGNDKKKWLGLKGKPKRHIYP